MHLRNCNYAVQTIRIYQIWLRFGNGFSFEVNLWMVVWSKFNLFLTNKDFNATKKWNIKNDPKLKLNLFIFIDDIPSIFYNVKSLNVCLEWTRLMKTRVPRIEWIQILQWITTNKLVSDLSKIISNRTLCFLQGSINVCMHE